MAKRPEDFQVHTAPKEVPVVLVGVYDRHVAYEQALEYLAELEFLATTLGLHTVATYLQKLDKPHPATFLGKGKVEEIAEKAAEVNAKWIVFDDDLSPTQVRNLEKQTKCSVLDRSGLILEIFSENARTAQAKTQVQLAKLEYELPRLRRMWTHLSRERGGIGLKGAGEQEIETDRRIIRDKIAKLRKQLEQIEKQTEQRRKQREQVVRVALVGYTNVGKSTLMNRLAKAEVHAENKLFATLDTTVRKVVLEGIPFLLSDTVGFIRKLPHNLIESFKSTLDEVREADILMHVVDISTPHYLDHIKVVRATLADMKVYDKPVLMVFNKVDQLEDDLGDLKETWMHREHYPSVFVSAHSKEGLPDLRNELVRLVRTVYKDKYPGLAAYHLNNTVTEVEEELL